MTPFFNKQLNMYIITVYQDLEQTKIIGLIYFSHMKDIITFTKNLIRYNDLKNIGKQKTYKTYKNLFKIQEVKQKPMCKYFSGNRFSKLARYDYEENRYEVIKHIFS